MRRAVIGSPKIKPQRHTPVFRMRPPPPLRRLPPLARGVAVCSAPATPTTTTRVCRKCDGTAAVPCPACRGRGTLPLAGYGAPRNTVNLSKVAGTSWTAVRPQLGRTHFHATGSRTLATGTPVVRLVATCDPATVLWVPVVVLKDRGEWAAGSLDRKRLAARRAGDDAGGGACCRTCGGTGARPCPLCSSAGEVVEV